MLDKSIIKNILDAYVGDYKSDKRNGYASAVLMRGMVMGAIAILWAANNISFKTYKSYLKKVDAGHD